MATLDELAKAGIQAVNDKKYDEAIEHFTGALQLEPDRPDLNNALGNAYLHRGEAGTAIPYLRKAVELAEPFDDAEFATLKLHFHASLASAYQVFDKVAEAREVLETAIARWPGALEPRLQLGQLLLTSCNLEDGLAVYATLADFEGLDENGRKAARAVVEAARAMVESDESGRVFLEAHQSSYKAYFDQVAAEQSTWYAEAARMQKVDGEIKPILTQGARPYALTRADLVNPEDNSVASVYSDTEPMIVAVQGLEPLSQIPIMVPWSGLSFDVWVCTQCPWHWLQITVQFEDASSDEARVDALDPSIGDWYLAGYNGDFGDKDSGRFHYITDPIPYGDRAVSYSVDLGRARIDAIDKLLERLTVLHTMRPIRRVLFGRGHLPD